MGNCEGSFWVSTELNRHELKEYFQLRYEIQGKNDLVEGSSLNLVLQPTLIEDSEKPKRKILPCLFQQTLSLMAFHENMSIVELLRMAGINGPIFDLFGKIEVFNRWYRGLIILESPIDGHMQGDLWFWIAAFQQTTTTFMWDPSSFEFCVNICGNGISVDFLVEFWKHLFPGTSLNVLGIEWTSKEIPDGKAVCFGMNHSRIPHSPEQIELAVSVASARAFLHSIVTVTGQKVQIKWESRNLMGRQHLGGHQGRTFAIHFVNCVPSSPFRIPDSYCCRWKAKMQCFNRRNCIRDEQATSIPHHACCFSSQRRWFKRQSTCSNQKTALPQHFWSRDLT